MTLELRELTERWPDRPSMVILGSRTFSDAPSFIAFHDRRMHPTTRIMQRALVRSLHVLDTPDLEIDMSSEDWWLGALASGTVTANRVPVDVPSTCWNGSPYKAR